MSYFKTSFETIQRLAQAGRYEDVAGFLVLARHATGKAVAGFDPYTLSGAGINGIHEKAGVSEETARGVVQRLQEAGLIKPASPETKKVFSYARWEIVQGELDLNLPHAITDPLKTANADSALQRIKGAVVHSDHAEALHEVSATEVRLDALMVLLSIYQNTKMEAFGGLSPHCAYRKWKIKSQTTKPPGIRWGAEPGHTSAYTKFASASLSHINLPPGKTGKEAMFQRFWNAWKNLEESGLVYEAVTLFDTEPKTNDEARSIMTLRVNDYHAGSALKTGDPSLLRSVETSLAFYTPQENEREEPEAMWVILPDKRGALVGIWRPRFRPATQDVGVWIDKENEAISNTLIALGQAEPTG